MTAIRNAVRTAIVMSIALAGVTEARQNTHKIAIEGILTDIQTGRVIEGDVSLVSGTTSRRMETYRTDAAGRYRIQTLSARKATLVARAPGYLSHAVALALDGHAEINFELSTPIRISGRVLDTSGLPLAGARVSVVYPDAPSIFRFNHEIGTTTSANGEFSLEYVRPGAAFLLEVDKPGFQPTFDDSFSGASQTRNNVVLVARKGFRLSGTVRNRQGKPVVGAHVTVNHEVPSVPFEIRRAAIVNPSRLVTTSNDNGAFVLSTLAPGSISIICRHPGYKPVRIALLVDQEETEADCTFLD